jgi:hypothetical protein
MPEFISCRKVGLFPQVVVLLKVLEFKQSKVKHVEHVETALS